MNRTPSIKNAKAALLNRDSVICGVWLFCQQLIVAFSTVFLVSATEAIQLRNYELFIQNVALFVGSLAAVHIPNVFSHIYADNAFYAAVHMYIGKFAVNNRGKARIANRSVRERYEAWITNECTATYREAADILYELCSTFLNAILSILAISYILDGKLLIWYAFAVTIIAGVNLYVRPTLETVAAQVQTSRKGLADVLLAAWDNVTIGNQYTFKSWRTIFDKSLASARGATMRQNVTRGVAGASGAFVALLAIGAGNYLYLLDHKHNIMQASAAVVTFPRQVQVLQNAFIFFGAMLQWHAVSRRLIGINEVLNVYSDIPIPMSLANLTFEKNGKTMLCSELGELLSDLRGMTNGRVTVRGGNATGKSTLLAYVAEHFGERAFYLPTNHRLFFQDARLAASSDGERMLLVLGEAVQSRLPKYLIFDEWDANLDQYNVRATNKLLSQLATRHVVVEARHRSNVSDATPDLNMLKE